MMLKTKLLVSILVIVIPASIFGQNSQFFYDYKFKMDSLNRDKIENEIMILETSPEGSHFYSHAKFVYDSTISATFKRADMTKQNHFDFTGLKNAKIKFSVIKKYPEYSTLFRTSISTTKVTLENKNKFDWKIASQKDVILGYKVQKATTNFQGRQWIAWFTNDIPIQDGPYRFFGLPGLILKLEDSKKDHVFTIIGTKKLDEQKNTKVPLEKTSREIVVSEEKFNDLWSEYKKDPAKNYRQLSSTNSNFSSSVSFGGKTYSQDEMIKEIESEGKKKLKTENNFIELKMYR